MTHARSSFRTFARAAVAVALVAAAPVATAAAQSIYPAFQPPRIVPREYNFAVADGDVGTSVLFQWREGWSPVSQLSFEAGVLDPDYDSDVNLLVGGNYARQLARAGGDMPLDLMLTLGANAAIGDLFILEVPVGISIGHRFPLEQGLALTPFLHPRVGLQYCNECDGGDSETDLGVAFDLGLDFEISPRMSLRGTAMFGDSDAIGISLAWRPQGLRR